MISKLKAIEVEGMIYPFTFNLNVMELIQDKFGSIDAWASKLTEENDIKAIKWSFKEMINEGIDIFNEENGTERPFLTLKQVGRIISKIGTEDAFKQVFDAVSGGIGESDPNENTTQKETEE